MLEILKNPKFDFVGKSRYFIAASILLILGGLGYMLSRNVYLGSNPTGYGVEFSGGTQLIVKFSSAPDIERVRQSVSAIDSGAVIQTFGQPSENRVLIRIAGATETELDADARRVLEGMQSRYPENRVVESSSEVVGPVVGAELRRNAVLLTVLGLLCQLIYIAIRFKGAVWGAAATIAVFHDVLVTLTFLALFGYEITLNVIAALLTLVGYSVNDTIVIFDRARENLRHKRKDPLRQLLNDSLNQTLTRTLISNGTTFLAVLGLYLFGGEVLRGFGFTMVVGILAGTYSTIYIASPIVAWWNQRRAGGGTRPATAKAAL